MNQLLRIGAALAALATAASVQAAPLELDLTGLRAGGKLYVQVQTRAQFNSMTNAAGKIVDAPAAGNLALTFDLPPGDYAARIWHDDNGNGTFDVDPASGMPLDGWSTVNAASLMGPPKFDDVKFTLGAAGAKEALALHYGR